MSLENENGGGASNAIGVISNTVVPNRDQRIQEGLRAMEEANGGGQKVQEGQEKYKATLARIAERERRREDQKNGDRRAREREQEELKRYKSLFGETPDEVAKSPKRLLKQLGHADPYKAFLDDDTPDDEQGDNDELPKSKAEMIKMYEEIAERKYQALKERDELAQKEKDLIGKFDKDLQNYADKFPLAVENVTANEVFEVMFEKFNKDCDEHGEEFAEQNKLSFEQVLETYQKHLESEMEKMLESKHVKRLLANKLGAKLPDDIDDVVQEIITSKESDRDSKLNSRLAEIRSVGDTKSQRERDIAEALKLMETSRELN